MTEWQIALDQLNKPPHNLTRLCGYCGSPFSAIPRNKRYCCTLHQVKHKRIKDALNRTKATKCE